MKIELRIQQYHRRTHTQTHTHTEWLLELLVGAKNLRWAVRVRTWSSPLCSLRTTSILLCTLLSKYQHPGWTNSVQERPNAGLPCK